MKVSKNNLIKMETEIKVLLSHYNVDIRDITDVNIMYQLWSNVHMCHVNNANVVFNSDGTLLFPFTPTHEFYVDGTNDTTIITALNWIINNNK